MQNIEKWHEKLFLLDMRRAVDDYGMIRPGSRILIGISGGKDSLTLGLGLEMLKRWLKTPFETVWIHLDYGAGGDPEPLRVWLAGKGVVLHVEPTDIWPSVEARSGGSPCYMCAKLRRGVLGRMLEKHNCDCMALGHHRDDAVATLWMNLLHNGRFRSFMPVSDEESTGRRTIRPLVYCEEAKIRRAAERFGFPAAPWQCPHEGDTERARVGLIRDQMRQALPGIDQNLLTALQNLKDEDGWHYRNG